jgi:glycosyltransferase involved in cell wall biosynthesis
MPPDPDKTKEKRRIFCIVTQGELGGAQQFVSQLSRHIDPDRFTLHVVWGATGQNALAGSLGPQTTYATAQHLVRAISPWHDVRAVYELRRQMLAYRPDIVLCISSKAGFVGSLAAHGLRAKLPGLKVVYRIGGWTFNDPWPTYMKRLYIWLERLSARWKDYIVLNNTHDLDQARTLKIRPRRNAVCIYNGLDPYMPFLARDEARTFMDAKTPDIARSTTYDWLVGTIANLYPTKDIPTLVRAAARVGGNVRFIVIGDGEQRDAIERLIKEYGLQKRFVMLGRIRDAGKYVTAFDVFALPSVKEGFPWALLEAMAARVPAVATRVGAVPEMIEDGVSGIVCEPGNPEQLARSMVRLLEDDKLRQDVAIAAHQRVISTFSLREMIDAYERLFTADDTSR